MKYWTVYPVITQPPASFLDEISNNLLEDFEKYTHRLDRPYKDFSKWNHCNSVQKASKFGEKAFFKRFFAKYIGYPCANLMESFNISYENADFYPWDFPFETSSASLFKRLFLVQIVRDGLRYYVKDGQFDATNFELREVMKRVTTYLISEKLNFCMLSDYTTNILLKITPNGQKFEFEDVRDTIVSVHFEAYIMNVNDVDHPVRSVLMAILLYLNKLSAEDRDKLSEDIRAVEQRLKIPGDTLSRIRAEHLDKRQLQLYTSRECANDARMKQPLFANVDSWEDGEAFRKKKFYKTTFKKLTEYFPALKNRVQVDVKGKDRVVLRLYDTFAIENDYSFSNKYLRTDLNLKEHTNMKIGQFFVEVDCYSRIERYNHSHSKHERINTAQLYDYGILHVSEGNQYKVGGYFMLMSYVKDDELITRTTIKDGREQLIRLNRMGIIHNGLAKYKFTILNEKIYFHDFRLALIMLGRQSRDVIDFMLTALHEMKKEIET